MIIFYCILKKIGKVSKIFYPVVYRAQVTQINTDFSLRQIVFTLRGTDNVRTAKVLSGPGAPNGFAVGRCGIRRREEVGTVAASPIHFRTDT